MYRQQIIGVLALLTEKTKSERGYTGTGRLLNRVVHTLAGVYPLSSRFVNSDEWEDPGALKFYLYQFIILTRGSEFDKDHNTQWGRLYEAADVVIEWHSMLKKCGCPT